ncbi:MAG: 4Fe-4S cluster-binding domain-containing protein, partial [Ferrimonas sp.]
SAGNPFTGAMADKIIADLQDPRIQRRGFSLSGGDPLHPANVGEITRLLQRIRAEAPDKDIWCWTGYELAALSAEQQQAVALMDVLVDGRFELAERDPTLLWRGSRNQQIHYLHQTTGTPHLG